MNVNRIRTNISNRNMRRATTMVEFAVILPVTLLVLIGPVVGGIGIFRYCELADLAREASRWASVHGSQYEKETGNTAATPLDVYNNVIKAKAVSLDLTKLSYNVTWNTDNGPYHTTIVNGQVVPVINTVKVTLTYQWIPELYFATVNLTSTSESVMSN